MNSVTGAPQDQAMGSSIGNLLRAGVMVAAPVVFFGGIIYLFRHGLAPADYRVFQRTPQDLCSVSGILRSVFSFHGRGFIQLGLLLLIATPLCRVALSVLVFCRRRDMLYAVITSFVLAVLIYGLFKR